jgi:rare lipoprotein A
LSRRAAELLDVVQNGTARVRVTYLNRADLAGGGPPPPETPPQIASALPAAPTAKVVTGPLGLVPGAGVAPPARPYAMPAPAPEAPIPMASAAPTGQVTQVPVPAATQLYVQVGAFSKLDNARTLLSKLGGGLRISALQRNGQTLYRVRTGPLNSVEDADAALSRITGAGSNDAQIVVDQ